jgi:hypothetical protein
MELSGLEPELSDLTGTNWAILTYLTFMLLSLYRASDEAKLLIFYLIKNGNKEILNWIELNPNDCCFQLVILLLLAQFSSQGTKFFLLTYPYKYK